MGNHGSMLLFPERGQGLFGPSVGGGKDAAPLVLAGPTAEVSASAGDRRAGLFPSAAVRGELSSRTGRAVQRG